MKRTALVALMAVAMLAVTVPSQAHRYERATNDNPFRLFGYALHPVGIVLEYLIMRPVHYVVSQPNNDLAFGHQASVGEEGTYFEYLHGDYQPSIASEMEKKAPKKKAVKEKKKEKEVKEVKEEKEKKEKK